MSNLLKNIWDKPETEALKSELDRKKNETESLLENVEEGVITLNHDFIVIRVNKIAEEITGKKSADVLDKNFFEAYRIYEPDKSPVTQDKFPKFDNPLNVTGFAEQNVQIENADKSLTPINFKLSPVIGTDGKIQAFLFLFSKRFNKNSSFSSSKVMLETLDRFETLLFQESDNTTRRTINFYQNLELLYKLTTGEIPGLVSDIDVGDSVRKIISLKEGLSYFYDVDLINSTPLSPPLPIKTNRFVFEKAIEKVIELGIFIASRSSNKFTVVSTGLSQENIFVFIKATVYENFPWGQAEELLKPFFGELSHEEKLLQASGLEGYLAESLLKAKGFQGGIVGQKFDDGVNNPQIILTVVLPYYEQK